MLEESLEALFVTFPSPVLHADLKLILSFNNFFLFNV
jgi:hypothetical protein